MWFGPTARLTVADPNLIREIFASKLEFYEKNEAHPLIKQLEGDGLLSLKGEKWAHHRKIMAPTFHMENLKVNTIIILIKIYLVRFLYLHVILTFYLEILVVDTGGGKERGGNVG